MNETPTGGEGPTGPPRRRRALRAVGGAVLGVALVTLVGGVLWLGTPQPLVTVMSPSMRPTLDVGDIALMQDLRGRAPRVGEIVEVPVPVDVQRDSGFPSRVVHRVVAITDGRVQTRGDGVDEDDPFDVPIGAVNRRLVTVVPSAGRVVSFLVSPFGLLWLGSGFAFLVVAPLIDGARRRHEVEQAQTTATLNEVVAAVGEYGQHLRSHTAILKAMSRAAEDLSAVVGRLDGVPEASPPTTDIGAYRRRLIAERLGEAPRP